MRCRPLRMRPALARICAAAAILGRAAGSRCCPGARRAATRFRSFPPGRRRRVHVVPRFIADGGDGGDRWGCLGQRGGTVSVQVWGNGAKHPHYPPRSPPSSNEPPSRGVSASDIFDNASAIETAALIGAQPLPECLGADLVTRDRGERVIELGVPGLAIVVSLGGISGDLAHRLLDVLPFDRPRFEDGGKGKGGNSPIKVSSIRCRSATGRMVISFI
jgi:hypothetical protein